MIETFPGNTEKSSAQLVSGLISFYNYYIIVML